MINRLSPPQSYTTFGTLKTIGLGRSKSDDGTTESATIAIQINGQSKKQYDRLLKKLNANKDEISLTARKSDNTFEIFGKNEKTGRQIPIREIKSLNLIRKISHNKGLFEEEIENDHKQIFIEETDRGKYIQKMLSNALTAKGIN